MWIAVAVIIVLAFIFIFPIIRGNAGREELKNLVIEDVDFKALRDGTFEGKFKGTKDSFRDVSVEVKISSGALTKIKVKKDTLEKRNAKTNDKYFAAVNEMFEKVVNAQSLKVDTVSGATLTCKSHLKAVENALEKAKVKE